MKKLVFILFIIAPFIVKAQVATLYYRYVGELASHSTIDRPLLISKEYTPVKINIYESSVIITHENEVLAAITNTTFKEKYSVALKRTMYILHNRTTSLVMDKAVDNTFLLFEDGSIYMFTNN